MTKYTAIAAWEQIVLSLCYLNITNFLIKMNLNESAVGIDLGTTNSCVAVFKDGVPEVIPNEFGDRTTPSMVIISKEGTRYVGKEAKLHQTKHIKNTIYESKRLIGRKYNEPCIQDRMLHWSFKVIENEGDGNPKISIPQTNKQRKVFYPEEISGMILEKMKAIAEAYIGHPVNKAVITVPAYFNDNQRKATIDAAKIAGLEVMKIMNEPTAAAFAYILKNGLTDIPSNTLVFDLGGGTFDVSIINTTGKKFTVLAVNGDPDLGGADFDNLIYNEIVNIMHKQVKQQLTFEAGSKERIKAQCLKVKEELSSAMSAQFDLTEIAAGFDFEHVFTREDFEKLIKHFIRKMIVVIKTTLLDAKMSLDDIDNIVLIGGSSKIPAVKKSLQEFFKKNLSQGINPDEAVACGAAYQAAILTENTNAVVRNVGIVDITPFSLGIEAEYVNMDVLIRKNTALPATFTKQYSTVEDNQTALRIKVFQGEDKLTENNTELGYFDLIGIPPAPARRPQIYVTFDINTNGVLDVTATERSSKERQAIRIVINTGRLSTTDITRITKENKKYHKKQQLLKKTEEEKNDVLKFCFEAKRTVNNIQSVSKDEKNDFIRNTDELITYLGKLSVGESNLQTLLLKKDELKKKYDDLVTPM